MAKKNFINNTHLEGLLYESNLSLKVTGPDSKAPGTQYISGDISVVTDNAMTNVCKVYYTYVTPTYAKGSNNPTFNILKSIIDKNVKTVMESSPEEAAKIKIDSAFALNEWYDDSDALISTARNENGFIHIVPQIDPEEKNRNTFQVDVLLTGTKMIEPDEERGITEHLELSGAVFNFRKELLPMTFKVFNPNAISYFEGLDISKKTPVFTKIWGKQESTTIKIETKEESAFGEPLVRMVERTRKSFTVTGAMGETYEWDDESTLLASEVTEAIAQREIHLAEIKSRRDEYKAKKVNNDSVAVGGFTF